MKKKTLIALLAVAVLAAAGCAGNAQTTTAAQTTAAPATSTTTTTEDTEAPEDEQPADTEGTMLDVDADTGETQTTEPETVIGEEPDEIRIAALKGPTAMGMVQLIDNSMTDETSLYTCSIYAAPDELTPLIIKGEVDIACIPANLAAVLYSKTEGAVETIGINTLGVLYIVENGTENVNSIADLKGKTIYASGQGSSPEYALKYLLTQNGIDPETDVTIEWKSEHAECLTAITGEQGGIAMLPQPFVTTAMMKTEGIRVALDLTKEWDALNNGSAMLTGVTIARKEFIDAYPEALAQFLADYKASVDFVNSDTDAAAALIGKEEINIIPEGVAKKALPACNIVLITGNEMKDKLSGYLNVLFDADAKSVGGKLPDEDFYYVG